MTDPVIHVFCLVNMRYSSGSACGEIQMKHVMLHAKALIRLSTRPWYCIMWFTHLIYAIYARANRIFFSFPSILLGGFFVSQCEVAADDSQAWKWPHAASGAHESMTKLSAALTSQAAVKWSAARHRGTSAHLLNIKRQDTQLPARANYLWIQTA